MAGTLAISFSRKLDNRETAHEGPPLLGFNITTLPGCPARRQLEWPISQVRLGGVDDLI